MCWQNAQNCIINTGEKYYYHCGLKYQAAFRITHLVITNITDND